MTQCKKTACLVSVIAVTAFMFLFERFFYGSAWMMELYGKTAALWRTQDDMKQYLPYIGLRDLVIALVVTCLYKKFATISTGTVCATTGEVKKCCPIQRGLCFGLKIGVFMGALQAGAYTYLPISTDLAVAWFAGSLVEGLGIGLVLSLLCNKNKGECAVQ